MRCIADTAPRPFDTGELPAVRRWPILRGFHPRDVPRISTIVAESLNEHYDPSLYLSLSQQWPDGFLVAAEPPENPVGFLLGVNQIEGEARILMFAVDRSFRSSGIGSRLMETFMERCRQRGTRRITLEVRVSNATALRFYTRYRFSVVDLLRGYYSDGENGYQMAREIV